ncbi:MAG: hypothetical protein ACLUT2_03850 [Clostridium sp.]
MQQQITDIFAECSIDYDKFRYRISFYATIQNNPLCHYR